MVSLNTIWRKITRILSVLVRFEVAERYYPGCLVNQGIVIFLMTLLLSAHSHKAGSEPTVMQGPFYGQSQFISSEPVADSGTTALALEPTTPNKEVSPGLEAQMGPVSQGLLPWRSKALDAATLDLAKGTVEGFTHQVTQLTGYNPFQIATIAGAIEVDPGMDAALASRINAALATKTDQAQVYLALPTLPGQPAVEAHLRRLGANVLQPIMPHGYAVKASAQVIGKLSQDPMVYAVVQSPWQLKIDPALAWRLDMSDINQLSGDAKLDVHPGHAAVQIYDADDRAMVQETIEALGITVKAFDERVRIFRLSGVDAAAAQTMAQLPAVSFVGAMHIDRIALDESVALVVHESIRDNESYDQDHEVIVGMIDSGFQLDHDAFLGQSGLPQLFVTAWKTIGPDEGDAFADSKSGHGTHVASIMLSRWQDGPLSRDLRGMAPREGAGDDRRFRYVRTVKDSCDPSIQNDPNCILVDTQGALSILADDNAALIINNSWSSDNDTGTNANSVVADGIVWDTGQILVFAAGNDRDDATCDDPETDPCRNPRINSPAAAKNVIAVGAVDKERALTVFSSEGPTSDGRRKPDIYAPGARIRSADANDVTAETEKSGTSMAAPHVTGFLDTLLGHYASFRRRPAVAKAYLMASASPYEGLQTHTGLLNSYQAHFSTSTSKGNWGWQDDDVRRFDFIYWDIDGLPSDLAEVIVVLTWIEPAPNMGATSAVQNDIDLHVDHHKDHPGAEGDWSSTTNNDNVEVVVILDPPAGDYRIKARKFNAVSDYRLGFALYYH